MATQYFYLALEPSTSTGPGSNGPYYYTNVFPLTFSDPEDQGTQQANYEVSFRAFVHNPPSYNSEWSRGYDAAADAATDRRGEIDALVTAGKMVSESNWP